MTKSKLKKIGTRIIAGVAIVALVIINIQVGINDKNVTDLSLSDLSMSLFTPAMAATGCMQCQSSNECMQGFNCINGCCVPDESQFHPETFQCPYNPNLEGLACELGGPYCDIEFQYACGV